MSIPGHCFVWLVMTGPMWSMYFYSLSYHHIMCYRIKEKLQNGQLRVARDQWPIFLYANYTYDPKDPWNGSLHSGTLILVSHVLCNCLLID